MTDDTTAPAAAPDLEPKKPAITFHPPEDEPERKPVTLQDYVNFYGPDFNVEDAITALKKPDPNAPPQPFATKAMEACLKDHYPEETELEWLATSLENSLIGNVDRRTMLSEQSRVLDALFHHLITSKVKEKNNYRYLGIALRAQHQFQVSTNALMFKKSQERTGSSGNPFRNVTF